MNLGDLILTFRRQIDDMESPQLFEDAEIADMFNEGEVEACRRARLIVDTTTPEICEIPVVALTKSYDLDKRIIYIRRVKLDGASCKLKPVNWMDLDNMAGNWENRQGKPTNYVKGMDNNKLILYPIPKANDTCRLMVVREPLARMESPNDEPEIAERYHYGLVNWVMYKALSKIDNQVNAEDKALKHLQLFEQEFGDKKLSSAYEEQFQSMHNPYEDFDGTY